MSIEKISVESKQELEQMITKEKDQIEQGLTIVCSHVPVNDKTTLDVLCHDSNGQIVVLQLNVEEDDNMLLQGIQSLDYVGRFMSFLKATYSKHKIDDKAEPRLILVAPSFSETLRRAVEHMQGIRIDLYGWEYLRLGDHKGLRLQPIFSWKPSEKSKEKREPKPAEKISEPKPERKKEKPLEKKEEPKPQPEPPEEEFPKFPLTPEKPEEEEPKPEKKKEPPKRKIRLF